MSVCNLALLHNRSEKGAELRGEWWTCRIFGVYLGVSVLPFTAYRYLATFGYPFTKKFISDNLDTCSFLTLGIKKKTEREG